MLKYTATLALLLLVLPAHAQDRAAVMDLRPKGNITASDASILTDRIRSLIVQNGTYQVMERENVDRILREQGFQSTQSCDTTDCSVEIGKLLSVRHMITGSASRLGNLYSLNLRIIDVEKGTILRDEYSDCLCPLESLMTQTAPALVRQALSLPSMPGNSATPSQQSPTALDDATPVRQAKPWLAYIEAGFPRYANLGAWYNANPYFALGAQAGAMTGSFTVNAYVSLAPRIYFNPHELAGFVDVLASVNFPSSPSLWLTPRLGIEYRPKMSGLTFSLAAGIPFLGDAGYIGNSYTGAPIYYRNAFDIATGIGWAF
jgi:hypothetical protein